MGIRCLARCARHVSRCTAPANYYGGKSIGRALFAPLGNTFMPGSRPDAAPPEDIPGGAALA